LSHLSLSLLGGFKIMLDGLPVTAFGADKVRALLAYLAVESARPHRRAILAGMFWPELSEERAAHNLSQSLLRLRRALLEDKARAGARSSFLLLTTQEVQFNPLSDYQLDVAEFQELLRANREHKHADADSCTVCIDWLRQAADLYRGDLLAGFSLRDSMPFEEWQVVQRETLHRQVVEALGRLTDYYERQGEPARVLDYARRVVALEPWQERAHMQVMAALAQTGQEAAALEQYTNYSHILAQEFGLAVSPEVAALYERIRLRQLSGKERQGATIPQPEALIGVPPMADERRQVTALLSQWQVPIGLDDPEEIQAGLEHFSHSFIETVERYGGWYRQRHGSEFLAYFGYPVAQENAAWHAVSAAMALLKVIRGRDHVRIGLHTGIMVSSGAELTGTVPDVARDCMRLAEPDTVLLTEDTKHLVHSQFVCQPMSSLGPSGPAPVYRVQAKTVEQNRPVWQAQAPRLTQLVGREAELQQLMACLNRVQGGMGQVITVCGEAGIGKTRLSREFKKMCPWPATWVETHCSPFFQNTSLHPIIDLLEQLLEFKATDDAASKRAKLAGALAQYDLASPVNLWLLSLQLGLPTDTPAPQTITEDQRERIREACLALLQREAARQPVMLLIEDLHWADPTTMAWLNRSLDALAAARCVLWLNWRQEFVAPWRPRPYLTALNLEPLMPLQVASLVRDVASTRLLPDEVLQQIVKQADGIPLYVEELTRTMVDHAAAETAVTARALPIPATLRDSLMVRLDRMGTARETAQWAAVLGREFEYPQLRAAVPFAEQRLQDDLTVLLESGLIIAQAETPPATYAFRHALIHETAYDSMLKRTRQDYHRRIAETLFTQFPHMTETRPEILAEHYSRSGLSARAADLWLQAGKRATAQGATLEARTFLDRALLEIDPTDRERRWRVRLDREAVFDLREERPAQREEIEALLALAETLNDNARRAVALLRQVNYANRMEDFQLMLQASEVAAIAASRQGDLALEAMALSRSALALARLEQWEAARPIVEELRVMLPEIRDDAAEMYITGGLSLFYSDVGDVARALLLRERGIELARRVGHRGSESRQMISVGFYLDRLGRYAEARAAYEQGLGLAEALGDRFLQTNLRFDLSYVLWCTGERDDARDIGERALQELRVSRYRPLAIATCLFYLGLILEDTANYPAAAAYLTESRTLYADGGLHGSSMEVQAVEARCLLALGRHAEARQLAAEVWAYLNARGTVTIDFPGRVYVCLADVFAQIPTPGITEREVLEAGHAELMRLADMISVPEWRRSFLEDELSNRALISRWERCLSHAASAS